MILEYARTHPNAHDPQRANPSHAGLDVFYSPANQEQAVSLNPGETRVIPTGLRVGIPHGYMLVVKNLSSVAAKQSLLVGACVVDPGYDGEIYVILHNIGVETQKIRPGDKLAHAVLVPVVHCGIEEAKADDLNGGSTRGEGGFGSTGDR